MWVALLPALAALPECASCLQMHLEKSPNREPDFDAELMVHPMVITFHASPRFVRIGFCAYRCG